MTETRESELMAHIPTLCTLDEARGFRAQLADQQEGMTGRVMAALAKRMDVLAAREGRL